MADQHNTNIPAMGNEITSDIPDIKENLEFHWDIIEQICLSTSQTSAIGNLLKQQFVRSKFTYNGGSTAYTVKCEPAIYHCKDKYCYWDSELTTTAVGTPAASTWYYLYLDYSAITSYTEITNSELAWSSTAPAWNDTYKAWMNSDDRCIFAVLTNDTPNNILEFFHDGGNYVLYADCLTAGTTAVDDFDFTGEDVDTTETDAFLPIPAFATKSSCTFILNLNGGTNLCSLNYFTKGQTGTTGHAVCRVIDYDNSSGGQDWDVNSVDVFCDSDRTIQVKNSATGGELVYIYVDGWYFPTGM